MGSEMVVAVQDLVDDNNFESLAVLGDTVSFQFVAGGPPQPEPVNDETVSHELHGILQRDSDDATFDFVQHGMFFYEFCHSERSEGIRSLFDGFFVEVLGAYASCAF